MRRKKHLKTLRHGNGTNGRKRANGTGTLEKRPGGWLARWHVRNRQGVMVKVSKLIPKSEEVPDIDAARQKLNELTKENSYFNVEQALLRVQNQLLGIRKDREAYRESLPAMKLDDAFEEFCKTRAGKKAASNTRLMYECQFGRFVRWVKENYPSISEIRQITRPIAREFSDNLLKSFSANTHNKYITLFSAIWNAIIVKEEEDDDAIGSGFVSDDAPKARLTINPWKNIEKVDQISHTRRELTAQEIRKLCNAADKPMKLLICLSLEASLRLHDAAMCRWESIDMDRGIIRLRPHKVERRMAAKNEWVTIPILPDLFNLLSEIPVEDRHGYVLPEYAEQYERNPAALSYHISKLFKSCGIQTQGVSASGRKYVIANFHSFRHTFVSIASRYRIPMSTIQVIVGHSSPAMTEHYLHISSETLKQQLSSFPRLLSSSDADIIDVSSVPLQPTVSSTQQETPGSSS